MEKTKTKRNYKEAVINGKLVSYYEYPNQRKCSVVVYKGKNKEGKIVDYVNGIDTNVKSTQVYILYPDNGYKILSKDQYGVFEFQGKREYRYADGRPEKVGKFASGVCYKLFKPNGTTWIPDELTGKIKNGFAITEDGKTYYKVAP